ncbi:MAG: hypothetical protein M9895_09950 [Aquamicrobium sp.]|uniref:hypothetical protein n=1 Tax=Aquamicrobium sp. TaxID=1872579 RepID=UPI00349ECA83|nr:hypothetical protein [Aquamicrobium sp.]
MRSLIAAALTLWLAAPSAAQEIVSAYTDIDADSTCSTFAAAAEGEGDWSNMVCAGYRGYPVVVHYGDLRESVFYGFPPDGDLAPAWESFSGFNRTGPRIEWRIERQDGRETPFATIHRWFVADGEGGPETEVLVVEKVGQIHGREGCVVGYVVASGNPDANGKARRIADGQARDFACGDQPTIDAGSVPLREFVHDRP